MSPLRLVLRSLVYRWRTNLPVALGTALAAAVLAASLGAGDSVRASLRRIALQRLGRTVYALEGGERFLRAQLAGEIAERLGGRAAALIAVRGSASARGGESRVPSVQVLGVDRAFWDFVDSPVGAAPPGVPATPGEDEVLLNPTLARALGAEAGDEVLLRVQSGFLMPGEAPLSLDGGATATLRLTVRAVIGGEALGDFGLRANQLPPANAFVFRETLAGRIQQPGRANTILLAPAGEPGWEPGREPAAEEVQRALAAAWTLEDAGLSLRRVGGAEPAWELLSDRVFLEPAVERAALEEGAAGVLTYFVDRIVAGGRSIPYSFVAGIDPAAPGSAGHPGPELGPDEILLNQWAARELGIPSDSTDRRVELLFTVPGATDRLEQRRQGLLFRGVVPIGEEDRLLMPRFPGLAGVDNCRDWQPGIPIDVGLIRDQDEEYWASYGGSPKAFVSLQTAQAMWGNRFGRLTAARFDGDPGTGEAIADRLVARLPASAFGLEFLPARRIALEAGASGVDFGGLFLALSFFLVAAALLLVALLVLLSLEQRRPDVGLFRALGFPRPRILGLLLAEGWIVAFLGSAAGLPLGLAFHRVILQGLRSVWRDAVRTPELIAAISPSSLLLAFGAGLLAASTVIAAALRGLARGWKGDEPDRAADRLRRWLPRALAAGGAAGALACLLLLEPPESFFVAGALLLGSTLAGAALLLRRLARRRVSGLPTIGRLGLENAARRRTRSLAVACLLACGLFVVTAVAANRRTVAGPGERTSGTGGFSLIAETAVPLVDDPSREAGRRALRLDSRELAGTGFVSFRVLEGDDASCLNLNRTRQPRLLGVDPASLSGRFRFARLAPGLDPGPDDPWTLLDLDLGPDTIAAVADQTVITWGLGLQVGDELEYRDESGEPLRVRLVAGLANSIFQGNLIVSEQAFLRRFPSASGYRLLLADSPPAAAPDAEAAQTIEARVRSSLVDYGVTVGSAAQRLARFNSVENTYAAIFGLLGWLGMLVGTLGLAVVVARNAAEGRREMALLRAVGLRRSSLLGLTLAENLPPLGLGLAAGVAASTVAVYPAATLRGSALPLGFLLLVVATIAAFAVACVAIAGALSARAELLPALRNE